MSATVIPGVAARRRLTALGVVALALGVRVVGLDWDQGQLLHPDERFMAMVGHTLRLPSSLAEHLDPTRSPLNPANAGQPFFVYGTLPLSLDVALARLTRATSVLELADQGRILAMLADLGTTLLVLLLGSFLERHGELPRGSAVRAALCYALAVTAIQQSRFFTVDPFVTLAVAAALTLAVRYRLERRVGDLAGAAAALGLGVACKVTALLAAPLVALLVSWPAVADRLWRRLLRDAAVGTAVALAAAKLADPRLFAGPWSLAPNPGLVASLRTLRALDDPALWFPPSVQWLGRPVWFLVENLALWGLGPVVALLALAGAALAVRRLRSERQGLVTVLLLAWAGTVLVLLSLQFAKTMRYALPALPVVALAAGAAWAALASKGRAGRRAALAVAVLLVVWPLAFLAVSARTHPRVVASRWLAAHLPAGAQVAVEHWDDPLPLAPWRSGVRLVALPVFDRDTDAKWRTMAEALASADVLVLSSPRAWATIPRVPERYPRMARFYADLFGGRLPFKKAAEFSSYPALGFGRWRIEIRDDAAEEAFTVYDHPRVIVFERAPAK